MPKIKLSIPVAIILSTVFATLPAAAKTELMVFVTPHIVKPIPDQGKGQQMRYGTLPLIGQANRRHLMRTVPMRNRTFRPRTRSVPGTK